jgi:hypothetical protein
VSIKRLKVTGQVTAAGRCRAQSTAINFQRGQFQGVRYSRVAQSPYVGFRLIASPFDTYESMKATPSKRKRQVCPNALLHFLLSPP